METSEITLNARYAMKWAYDFLKESRVPKHDSEHILSFLTKSKRIDLLLDNPQISIEVFEEFKNLIKIRAKGYPLQYILGSVSFMGIELQVNEDVLIPRPETEILVEKVIEKLTAGLLIADIGTGCGNIAIGLTKNIDGCKILASDISGKAVKIARDNAGNNGVEDRIKFFEGNLFEPFGEKYQHSLDAVVSNPPYIKSADIKALQREIQHEPRAALDGGIDGLDFIEKIASQAKRYLKDSGMIAMEIGFDQKDAVEGILIKEDYKEICFHKDYSNIDRIVTASKG